MKILIIAEHDNQLLKPATYHTITAAKELGDEIDILIMGFNCQSVAEESALITGIKKVLIADADCYQHQLAENCAKLTVDIATKHYNYVLTGATTFGKNLLPRVAALLDVSMLADVMQIISADTFVRPMYAGNVLATIKTAETLKILTVRISAFTPSNKESTQKVPIENISTVFNNELARFESQQLTKSERPELTSAKIIISGGRGLKNKENFHLLEEIADRLGAAVGASRAAVDAGLAPNDYQVGQTGKVVAPDLYIAVGISGAIQHLAGMKDSKVIVAINNDPEAPILQIADYALIGDLFKILPELREALDKN